MTDVHVFLPPISDDQVSNDLVWLTELLHRRGAEISGGLLGGEFGYGAEFENETFMMHPFCWCESPTCPWCLACFCVVEDRGERIAGMDRWVTTSECSNCTSRAKEAPNFLHKPSGSEVRWYKYIGRGMEVDLKTDWRSVLDDVVRSLGGAA